MVSDTQRMDPVFENTSALAPTNQPPSDTDVVDSLISTIGFWSGIFINSVGIFGNLLILVVTKVSRSMRTSKSGFIASLAVSNLAAILCCNTLQIRAYGARRWPFSFETCIFQSITFGQFNLTSLAHISVIAIYRFLAAVHPHQYHIANKTRNRTLLLVALYCSMFCLAAMPQLWSVYLIDSTSFQSGIDICGPKNVFPPILVLLIFLSFSTAVIVMVSYGKIRATIQSSAQAVHGISVTHRKIHLNVVICMSLTLLLVVLGYVPLLVSFIFYYSDIPVTRALSLLSVVMIWIGNASNWIVYGLLNKEYRQAYTGIFRLGTQEPMEGQSG